MPIRETVSEMVKSSRFVYIQEGIFIGLLGAVLKVFFPRFPLTELYAFTAPIVLGAFGLKTWGHTKNGGDDETKD